MLKQYGFEFKDSGGWLGYSGVNPSNDGWDVYKNSLYITNAGHIRLTIIEESGVMAGMDANAWLWSNTSDTNKQKAYYWQTLGKDSIYPVVYDFKLWGFSLRCVTLVFSDYYKFYNRFMY